MRMRLSFTLLVVTCVLAASGCGKQSVESVSPEPQSIVSEDATAQAQAALESLFAAWESRDEVAAESYLPEYRHGGTWYFERLDRVEFGPASPDPSWIPGYMSNGTGSWTGAEADNIRCFQADATFYYTDPEYGPAPHGEPMEWHWFLERDDEGEWLVTDWGY